ncbi:MAG: hypothetical protein ABH828_01025 [archaeon]
MSKNDKRFIYKKNGQPYLVINKIDASGNSIWQKEIPKDFDDIGSGAHITLGKDDQFHYDVYSNDGSKEILYKDALMIGSTAIPSGETIFHKSPEQEFNIMPIRDSPTIINTKDLGNKYSVEVDKEGKIFYVVTKKE